MSEKHQSEITLHNISASIMDDVLDFCYTETVTLTEDNVQELLLTACLLQLYGITYYFMALRLSSMNFNTAVCNFCR